MTPSVSQLADDAAGRTGGGPRALRAAARLMSVMTDQPQRLGELLAGSAHWPQPRLVLGITGAPGSGKSTLTDQIATEYRTRYPDRKLGVVAVDPSSPFTGGALLGDRVRMMRHATDPNVFIRSLASRGHLGGLALGAKGVVRVMGLIGCDVVIIETVGVGQSEVEIAGNADLVMVVLAPGQGDSVQMLKAGLMEAGDLFVVNKADRDGADALYQQLLGTLNMGWMARLDLRTPEPMSCHAPQVTVRGLQPTKPAAVTDRHADHPASTDARLPGPDVIDGEKPAVFLTSAASHTGVPALVDALEATTHHYTTQWQQERHEQAGDEVRLALLESVRRRVGAALGYNGKAQARIERLLRGETSLDQLTDEVLRDTVAGATTKETR